MADALSILCLSRSHERMHYAFVLAAGAAAIGCPVLLFATNGALHGLCRDWSGLDGVARDERVRTAGVAGLAELREAALALGVRLMACEAGLLVEGIEVGALLEQVEIAGVTTFLSEAGARVVTL